MSQPTIILDTNVISEIMRVVPDPLVIAWYLKQDSELLSSTAVTQAEVLFGLDLMPAGRRRERLTQLSHRIFEVEFKGRLLPFDHRAARHYAELRAKKRRRGFAMAELDAQIAAIALNAGASIATRNVSDFEHCGVMLIDPWLAPSEPEQDPL